MQNLFLLDYIKNNFDIDTSTLDSLRCELDQRIHHYGCQFKYPKEYCNNRGRILNEKIKNILRKSVLLSLCLLKRSHKNGKENIFSNAYFSINDELGKLGFNVYRPPWNIGKNFITIVNLRTYKEIEIIKKYFYKKRFIDIISCEIIDRIFAFKSTLKRLFLDYQISALFVPNDVGFFDNLSIKIFSEIGKPSFIFLHGLPGRYNCIDENRSDYLIVWGEKIKENYVKAGIDKDKIFISGHPYYRKRPNNILKFSLDSPLIITKSMLPAQHSDAVRLADRGNLILYLYSIKLILNRFGVKHVRFRPHPEESSQWYLRFIDNDFFKPDYDDLQKAIRKSSVIIGPSSTIFLESLFNGVNYICYEPSKDDIDFNNFKLVPPFDGSDMRVPVAKNEEQLEQIIKEKAKVDLTIFNDYIKTPFDISFVRKMI